MIAVCRIEWADLGRQLLKPFFAGCVLSLDSVYEVLVLQARSPVFFSVMPRVAMPSIPRFTDAENSGVILYYT